MSLTEQMEPVSIVESQVIEQQSVGHRDRWAKIKESRMARIRAKGAGKQPRVRVPRVPDTGSPVKERGKTTKANINSGRRVKRQAKGFVT